jgi:Ni/Co efflux regulator RcnB
MKLLIAIAALGLIATPAVSQTTYHSRDDRSCISRDRNDTRCDTRQTSRTYDRGLRDRSSYRDHISSPDRSRFHRHIAYRHHHWSRRHYGRDQRDNRDNRG